MIIDLIYSVFSETAVISNIILMIPICNSIKVLLYQYREVVCLYSTTK